MLFGLHRVLLEPRTGVIVAGETTTKILQGDNSAMSKYVCPTFLSDFSYLKMTLKDLFDNYMKLEFFY